MTIDDKNVFTKNVSLNIFLPFHLNGIDVGPVSEAREFEKIHRREKKLFVEQRDDFYFSIMKVLFFTYGVSLCIQ